ncbi:hypothetical protein C8Q76DRAFT_802848 [Earliella scabrosa]|nr:hypothetical protein C8Q76DRAFT_802848 [Earliella scabrosa]
MHMLNTAAVAVALLAGQSAASPYMPFRRPVPRDEASESASLLTTAADPSSTVVPSVPVESLPPVIPTDVPSGSGFSSLLPTTTPGVVTIPDPIQGGLYTLSTDIPVTTVYPITTTITLDPPFSGVGGDPSSVLSEIPVTTNATVTLAAVPYTTVVSAPASTVSGIFTTVGGEPSASVSASTLPQPTPSAGTEESPSSEVSRAAPSGTAVPSGTEAPSGTAVPSGTEAPSGTAVPTGSSD